MIPCERACCQLHAYLDGELPPAGRVSLETHLLDCAKCQEQYAALRETTDAIRGAGPLYEPPEGAAERLRAALDHLEPKAGKVRGFWWTAAAAAAACAAVLIAFSGQPASANELTRFAADAHLRYVRGVMPLDIASSEPAVVADWLSARLPFHLDLPEYPAGPGALKSYELTGARLLQLNEADVAYLAYEMGDRPISLLIASAAAASPAGEQTYRSGPLEFRFSSQQGLQLISWEDRGLVYTLASDVRSAGAESCVICHGAAEEREKFEKLSPID